MSIFTNITKNAATFANTSKNTVVIGDAQRTRYPKYLLQESGSNLLQESDYKLEIANRPRW